MEANLKATYDRKADILRFDKVKPYAEQETEELGDDTIARMNPSTNEIENIEIFFFSIRLLSKDVFEIPVLANFKKTG